jgi:hypothetical protein
MLLTRRPDALLHVELANFLVITGEKTSKLLVFPFYYLYDIISSNFISSKRDEIIKPKKQFFEVALSWSFLHASGKLHIGLGSAR